MSFIQRERDRINLLIRDGSHPNYAELYAAQQALSWAQDPNGFSSPVVTITGIQGEKVDCRAEPHPQ
jgi:hypothetical protein